MYGTLQTVNINAAHFPEMAKEQGMANVPNVPNVPNVQPTGVFAERKTVCVVDSPTGCLRMTSEVLPLVKYLSNLQTFAVPGLLSHLPCTRRNKYQRRSLSTQQLPENKEPAYD